MLEPGIAWRAQAHVPPRVWGLAQGLKDQMEATPSLTGTSSGSCRDFHPGLRGWSSVAAI